MWPLEQRPSGLKEPVKTEVPPASHLSSSPPKHKGVQRINKNAKLFILLLLHSLLASQKTVLVN
jgi:hypothetical protein